MSKQFVEAEKERTAILSTLSNKTEEIKLAEAELESLKKQCNSLLLDRMKDGRQIQLLEMQLNAEKSKSVNNSIISEINKPVRNKKFIEMQTFMQNVTKRMELTFDMTKETNKKLTKRIKDVVFYK